MSEFVQECLREWRRLGVPDAVANEMAADLLADLDEAEAEGGTPEDVLGNSAFDPRRFAASWAVARGVAGPPPFDRRFRARSLVVVGLSVILVIVALGAAVALTGGVRHQAVSVAVNRVAGVPGSIRLYPPDPPQIQVPNSFGPPFVRTQFVGSGIPTIASAVLISTIVGLGVLAVLFCAPRYGRRRNHRDGDGGPRFPSWN